MREAGAYFHQEEPNGLICSYKVKPKVRVAVSPKQLSYQLPTTVKLPHPVGEARSDLLYMDLNNVRV